MRRPILNHTKRSELVYEPFLGSGTTLAAATTVDAARKSVCGRSLTGNFEIIDLRFAGTEPSCFARQRPTRSVGTGEEVFQ